jgi:hypothetical protein
MQTSERKTQFGTLAWVIVATVTVLPIGGCLVMLIGSRLLIHAIVVGETGPIESSDKWPDPLKKLVEARPEIAIETIRVHQLCQGFDPEYVIRIDAPTDLMDYVVETWELTEVSSPRLPSVFNGRSQISGVATPEWWKPSSIQDIKYYVCPRTLAGEKSDRFQVAYSESTNSLYVHYWFNF